jgi:P-type conjugative transfer protein TrbL
VARNSWGLFLVALGFILFAGEAEAAIDASGVLTDVKSEFQRLAANASGPILASARTLFVSLAAISLVWDFGFLALRRADLSDFLLSFVGFVLPLSLFWFFLENGPNLGKGIIQGFLKLGGQATGTGITEPSQLVQYGFDLLDKAWQTASIATIATSISALVLAFGAYVLLFLIAANYLVQLCAGWIVLYAGCFLLGFGGAQITRELAVQYFRTLIGIGLGLLTMLLLMGIGGSVLSQYIAKMAGPFVLHEFAIVLGIIILLYALVDKLPGVMGGMVAHSLSHNGIGRYGFGTLVAAGEAAAAGATWGAKGISSGISRMANGARATWNAGGHQSEARQFTGSVSERMKAGAAAVASTTAKQSIRPNAINKQPDRKTDAGRSL